MRPDRILVATLVSVVHAAPAAAQVVSLDRIDDPVALEQQLRALVARAQAGDLAIPGATVHFGTFAVGTREAIQGHLLVLQGTAEIHGTVEGNVVALDGDVAVHRDARVVGDAVALGGRVRTETGAVTGGVRSLGAVADGRATGGRLGLAYRVFGLLGVLLVTLTIGFGLVTFARPALETVSDTVTHSLGRSFLVGLLAEVLAVPTFGTLMVGLALTIVGVVLIPFAVVAYGLLLLACLGLGVLAVAHAMGEIWSRRRMALGHAVSPNSYRYVWIGLLALASVWGVWALFGWVPFAGAVVLVSALIATWLLVTVGLGASILSRIGVRPDFAGRLVPAEALTDEYLWATPQLGVPAVNRPPRPDR